MSMSIPLFVPGSGSGVVGPTEVIRYTGTAPLKGQWVCMASGALSNTVVVATGANLDAAGVTRGIAIADASGGIVQVADDTATVDATISGLASKGIVGIDRVTARSVLLDPSGNSGAEYVGGNSDNDGKLTVKQFARSPNARAPIQTLNPKQAPFNAPWTLDQDNTPAWDAMMASIPTGRAVRIDLPEGLAYFAGSGPDNRVSIKRSVHLHGRGGGSSVNAVPSSGFRLGPLAYLSVDGASTSDDGGDALFSQLEHFYAEKKTLLVSDEVGGTIYNTINNVEDQRKPSTHYVVGQVVVYSGTTVSAAGISKTDPLIPGLVRNAFAFVADATGTTAAGNEASVVFTGGRTFANAQLGDTAIDGGVTWRCISVPKDLQPLTNYGVGEEAITPGDPRWRFRAVEAGTSDTFANQSTNPGFIAPSALTDFYDGTVRWRPFFAGVMFIKAASVRTRHIVEFGGLGFAQHSESGYARQIVGNPDLTFVGGATQTITRSGGVGANSFIADGFTVGEVVTISQTASNNGVFTIVAPLTATVMKVAAGLVNEGPVSNAIIASRYIATDFVDCDGLDAFNTGGGWHCQGNNSNGDTTSKIRYYGSNAQPQKTYRESMRGNPAITFDAVAHTATRPGGTGSFIAEGFVVGDVVQIFGAPSAANNGLHTVANVAATVLTFTAGMATEGPISDVRIWVTAAGDGRSLMGTGEICTWDRALSGAAHHAPYSQFANGPAFVSDNVAFAKMADPGGTGIVGGNGATFHNAHSENYLGDIVFSFSNYIGTYTGPLSQPRAGTRMVTATRARGIEGTETATDGTGKVTKYTIQQTPTPGVATYGIAAGADIGFSNLTGWWTDKVNSISIGTGWLALAWGPNLSAVGNQPRAAFGVSYADSQNTNGGPGPGICKARIFDGYFGRSRTLYYGTDDTALQDNSLRYGFRDVGDSFPVVGASQAVGTPRRCVVAVAGYRGVPWTAGLVYLPELVASGIEATVVEEPSTPATFTDGTTGVWKYAGGSANNGVLPNFAGNRGASFTDANGANWTWLGYTPTVNPADFVDGIAIGFTPQTDVDWVDSVATGGTTAAKARVRSRRRSAQTTTNAASQVLLTTPTLTDNATTIVDVLVQGKKNGAAEAVSCKLSGTFYRNAAGAPVRVGTDDNAVKGTAGVGTSTFDLNINGNAIEVRTTPGANVTVDWAVEAQLSEGKS